MNKNRNFLHTNLQMKRKGCEKMNFIKGKAGLLLLLLSVMLILAAVWFCLFDMHIYAEPHGTFVEAEESAGEMAA